MSSHLIQSLLLLLIINVVAASKDHQLILPPNAILVAQRFDSLYEKSIAVVDRSSLLPEFGGLDETSPKFFPNNTRFLMFGARAFQSGASLLRSEDDSSSSLVSSSSSSAAASGLVNRDAPPIFRYISALAVVIPFYEARIFHPQCNEQVSSSSLSSSSSSSSPESMLLIGLGSGSIIHHFRRAVPSLARIDAIELDQVVVDFAVEFFGLRLGADANVTVGDAAKLLNILHDESDDVADDDNNIRSSKKSQTETETEQTKRRFGRYDLIVVDCGRSFNGSNIDGALFPKRRVKKGTTENVVVDMIPDQLQPVVCYSTKMISTLYKRHLELDRGGVIAFNFCGALEASDQKGGYSLPFERLLKSISAATGNKNPVVQPSYIRKWRNQRQQQLQPFLPSGRGHPVALHFDNLIVFVSSPSAHVPSVSEVVAVIERDKKKNRWGSVSVSTDFFLDLARNRYELLPDREDSHDGVTELSHDEDDAKVIESDAQQQHRLFLRRHRTTVQKQYFGANFVDAEEEQEAGSETLKK